jgi:molybdopterin synthase sulfur carrier subunit
MLINMARSTKTQNNYSLMSNQISDLSNPIKDEQIKVNVKLFAAFQEVVSKPEIYLEVPLHSPVSIIYEKLATVYPVLERWRTVTRYAINLNFADENTPLNYGDEVALIPPVSGG